MANVERTQKMVPLITCEISLCQYICELVCGVTVFDLDLGVQIDSLPIKSNSVGSGNMSHCKTSPLYDHLDHCFVVFKDVQQSFLTRRTRVRGNEVFRSSIFPGIFFRVGDVDSSPVLDDSDAYETEVCFLHIQLIGTNVCFQRYIMFHPKWISNLQDLPQNRSLETVPTCIVFAVLPT